MGKARDEVVNITSPLLCYKESVMSYLFELRMQAGTPRYVIADGTSREEALAQVHEQLGMEDEDELTVLAVHTVH